jgi:hypothetical protein
MNEKKQEGRVRMISIELKNQIIHVFRAFDKLIFDNDSYYKKFEDIHNKLASDIGVLKLPYNISEGERLLGGIDPYIEKVEGYFLETKTDDAAIHVINVVLKMIQEYIDKTDENKESLCKLIQEVNKRFKENGVDYSFFGGYERRNIEENLKSLVEDWISTLPLDSEEEVSGAMAETNSIFTEQYCENVELRFVNKREYSFVADVSMPHSEPRGDDVPYSASDCINVEIVGTLAFYDELEKWDIDDYNVTAGVENLDWIDAEENAEYLKKQKEEYLNKQADELLSQLSRLSHGLWFRGLSNSSWKLETSIARVEDVDFSKEEKLRDEFEKRIAFLPSVSLPIQKEELTFLMQHHGLPTRLLDWTTNPLVALFFALWNDKEIKEDGCIYVLDPSQLNRCFKQKYPVKLSNEHLIKHESDTVIAVMAPHTNTRMSSQNGEFTVHYSYKPLEDIKLVEEALNEKIVVKAELKSVLTQRLKQLGIDIGTLFPDLDHIGKSVVEDVG